MIILKETYFFGIFWGDFFHPGYIFSLYLLFQRVVSCLGRIWKRVQFQYLEKKGMQGWLSIGNYENKILNRTALNYSKSHGPEEVIGREMWSLSVQLNNYLLRTSD